MAKLLELVESHPDVIISIRAADLLAANEELIRGTRQEPTSKEVGSTHLG